MPMVARSTGGDLSNTIDGATAAAATGILSTQNQPLRSECLDVGEIAGRFRRKIKLRGGPPRHIVLRTSCALFEVSKRQASVQKAGFG